MDVIPFRVVFCLLFVVLGAYVLWTYWDFYKYYQRIGKEDQALVWAIWGHPVYKYAWGLLATLSTVAFIAFSIWIPINASEIARTGCCNVVFSYGLFLLFSCAYGPSMSADYQTAIIDQRILKKCVVMFDLILVSIALIVLFVWIQEHVGWSPAGNACLTTGMLILTIHCTVLDCILWGFSWCLDMIYDLGETGNSLQNSVSAPCPPPRSRGRPSRGPTSARSRVLLLLIFVHRRELALVEAHRRGDLARARRRSSRPSSAGSRRRWTS
jgi:hypothetical protein